MPKRGNFEQKEVTLKMKRGKKGGNFFIVTFCVSITNKCILLSKLQLLYTGNNQNIVYKQICCQKNTFKFYDYHYHSTAGPTFVSFLSVSICAVAKN